MPNHATQRQSNQSLPSEVILDSPQQTRNHGVESHLSSQAISITTQKECYQQNSITLHTLKLLARRKLFTVHRVLNCRYIHEHPLYYEWVLIQGSN